MNHQDDHILRSDETFNFQGNLPMELAKKFEDKKRPRITLLQGFIACGKTRTSKEFVRLLARNFREQEDKPNEVHTFLFDLRHKSAERLLKDICEEFKDKVRGWESYGNVENVRKLIGAFGKERDRGRVFLIILNKVDRAQDKERPQILEFVQNLVSNTNNVYMVLTSRTDVTFVRESTKVMKHQMKPMELDDAKELLKETSRNPESLDKYADRIYDLVGGSPLALMIAGHEMNGMNTQLPYTPKELVGVITDSTSLSLDLENVPAEDSIISMVADIVRANFHVLEKIIIALDCPQLFDTEDLEVSLAAVSGPPSYEGQIKQTILRAVLGRSLYGLNREGDSGVSFKSSPLLIEVLKETFCQLTSEDRFLEKFNKNLVNTLDDTSPLMRSEAKELRQAEIHLLRNQKGPKVTSQEVQDCWRDVIMKATVFLESLGVNAMTCSEFQTNSMQILNEWKRAEAPKETMGIGIQKTCSGQQEEPVIACENLPRMSHESKEKELEAWKLPKSLPEIVLPGFKDTNQAVATAKTTRTEAGKDSMCEEAKRAVGTNPQKEDNGDLKHRGSEKKNTNGFVCNAMGSPNLQERPVIPALTCIGKTAGSEEISKSDVHVNDNKNMTSVSKSFVTPNVFTNKVATVGKKFGVVTHTEGKNDHLGEKTNHEVKKPPLQPEVETSITTTTTAAIITTNSETQTSHPPPLQHSHPKDRRNKTRSQGILGPAPLSSTTSSNSTSSSFQFPANAQGPRLPSQNNLMPYQNTSFTPPDRGYSLSRGYGLYGHPHIQQQGQMMLPGPFQPHAVQWGSYSPLYNGDSVPYNQFDREYNGAKYQGSLYNFSNDRLRRPLYRYPPTPLQNRDSAPQACALPVQSSGSSPSPSFRPRGPSCRYMYPYTHRHPHQSHVSNPPSRFQAQATLNRFPQAYGSPFQTSVSSLPPSFCPQRPSYSFPPAYGPSHQNYVSTPQPSCEMQSSSQRFSQVHGPPFQNSGSSLSSGFQLAEGPPAWNVPRLPQSLKTDGFYVPPDNRNDPPSQFNQRNHDHHHYRQNRQQSGTRADEASNASHEGGEVEDYPKERNLEQSEEKSNDIRDDNECKEDMMGNHAEGLFHQGGELSLETHGCILHIPPGALEEESPTKITLEVLTELPDDLELEEDEMVVSPGFKCLPSGLHFKKPVKLIMPHCAVLKDPRRVKTVLHSWSHEIAGKIERIPQTPSTCIVHHSHFELLLEHFSYGWLTMIWDWLTGKGKMMCCMPYLPKTMPASRKPVMELRLQNKPNKSLEYAPGRLYQPALDEDYQIMIERKDLKITCDCAQEDHETEILEYSHIFSTDRCKVAFILDLQSDQENTAVTLKLIQNKTYRIMFDTGCMAPFDAPHVEVLFQETKGRDPVTDDRLNTLSTHVPHEKYTVLSEKLGISYNKAQSTLKEHSNDYQKAIRKCFAIWRDETGGSLAVLRKILCSSGLFRLSTECNE